MIFFKTFCTVHRARGIYYSFTFTEYFIIIIIIMNQSCKVHPQTWVSHSHCTALTAFYQDNWPVLIVTLTLSWKEEEKSLPKQKFVNMINIFKKLNCEIA